MQAEARAEVERLRAELAAAKQQLLLRDRTVQLLEAQCVELQRERWQEPLAAGLPAAARSVVAAWRALLRHLQPPEAAEADCAFWRSLLLCSHPDKSALPPQERLRLAELFRTVNAERQSQRA